MQHQTDFKSVPARTGMGPAEPSFPYNREPAPTNRELSRVDFPKPSSRFAMRPRRPFNLSLAIMLIRRKPGYSYASMAKDLDISRQSIDRWLEDHAVTKSRRSDLRTYVSDRLTDGELERCGDLENLGL